MSRVRWGVLGTGAVACAQTADLIANRSTPHAGPDHPEPGSS